MINTRVTTGKGSLALGCFSLLVLIVIFGFLIWALWRALCLLDPTVSSTLVTVSGTVIVTGIIYILSKNIENKREIESRLRELKLPVYKDFLKGMFRIFMQEKPWVEKLKEEDLGKFFHELTEKLILWGSDDLLKKWGLWRIGVFALNDPSVPDKLKREVFFGFEDVLFAIRKDLGHKNKGLKRGDIFRLWINDIDEFLK